MAALAVTATLSSSCSVALPHLGSSDTHTRRQLPDAAAVETLNDVCSGGRRDPLCVALRAAAHAPDAATARGHYARALAITGDRVRTDTGRAVADAAVRYLVRERVVARFVWEILRPDDEDDEAKRSGADAVLQTHFPLYRPETFHLARTLLPPQRSRLRGNGDVLLIYPGVVRIAGGGEFAEQVSALGDALPGIRIAVVGTHTLNEPALNARETVHTLMSLGVAAGDDVRLHLLGYSQGATNALWTLTDHTEVSYRARSVVVLNSAAHGSEVADAAILYGAGGLLWDRPLRDARRALDLGPAPSMLARGARATIDGVYSLTTWAMADFWRTRAHRLPRDAIYLSLRSMITDKRGNLPASNWPFYELLRRVGRSAPDNDMQVRLVNQRLGAEVADVEVVAPVLEGNHWQWALAPADVSALLIPRRMLQDVPRRELLLAVYLTLAEVGILAPDARGPAVP